jgi:LysM repeat protein
MTNSNSVIKKDQITYFPLVNKDAGSPPGGSGAATPSAEPTAQATAMAASEKYVVESGDTLFTIASKYGLSVDDLVAANQIPDRDQIKVGQELVIPGARATPKP